MLRYALRSVASCVLRCVLRCHLRCVACFVALCSVALRVVLRCALCCLALRVSLRCGALRCVGFGLDWVGLRWAGVLHRGFSPLLVGFPAVTIIFVRIEISYTEHTPARGCSHASIWRGLRLKLALLLSPSSFFLAPRFLPAARTQGCR